MRGTLTIMSMDVVSDVVSDVVLAMPSPEFQCTEKQVRDPPPYLRDERVPYYDQRRRVSYSEPARNAARMASLRPDAIIQGIGCLMMAATACFVIHALVYGSAMLDVEAVEHYTYVFPLLLLTPYCLSCGCLFIWSGCGGHFPAVTAAIRCDLPPTRAGRQV